MPVPTNQSAVHQMHRTCAASHLGGRCFDWQGYARSFCSAHNCRVLPCLQRWSTARCQGSLCSKRTRVRRDRRTGTHLDVGTRVKLPHWPAIVFLTVPLQAYGSLPAGGNQTSRSAHRKRLTSSSFLVLVRRRCCLAPVDPRVVAGSTTRVSATWCSEAWVQWLPHSMAAAAGAQAQACQWR